jgi:serine/threonine protein kinase
MQLIVSKKYQLSHIVGRGKFGTVLSGINIYTNSGVAVKIEERMVGMLKKEAKIYRLLREIDGIPQLFDYGTAGRYAFLAMTLIEKRTEPISLAFLSTITPQLVEILRHIHTIGIIHCDIKPANIVISKGGKPYFVDFGLSRFGKAKSDKLLSIVGSRRFCSRRVVELEPPRALDDLESLVLTILWLGGRYAFPYDRDLFSPDIKKIFRLTETYEHPVPYESVSDDIVESLSKQMG